MDRPTRTTYPRRHHEDNYLARSNRIASPRGILRPATAATSEPGRKSGASLPAVSFVRRSLNGTQARRFRRSTQPLGREPRPRTLFGPPSQPDHALDSAAPIAASATRADRRRGLRSPSPSLERPPETLRAIALLLAPGASRAIGLATFQSLEIKLRTWPASLRAGAAEATVHRQPGAHAPRVAGPALGDEEGCAVRLRAAPFLTVAAWTRAKSLAAMPFGASTRRKATVSPRSDASLELARRDDVVGVTARGVIRQRRGFADKCFAIRMLCGRTMPMATFRWSGPARSSLARTIGDRRFLSEASGDPSPGRGRRSRRCSEMCGSSWRGSALTRCFRRRCRNPTSACCWSSATARARRLRYACSGMRRAEK